MEKQGSTACVTDNASNLKGFLFINMSQERLTVASLRTDVNESDMGRKSAATQAKAYAERCAVSFSVNSSFPETVT